MDKKELLNYIYKNYKNIDVEKEFDKVIKFINIYIYEEQYKVNKKEKHVDAFVTLYAKVKMKEKNFDYKVITTGPKDSKRKFKVNKYIDTWDRKSAGGCNKERVNIKLTHYLIKQLYSNKQDNFTQLIDTINHELKHAKNYTESEIKHDILTSENYYQLKFNLLLKEAPGWYQGAYWYLEEEIGAFQAGLESVAETYKDNNKEIYDKYMEKINYKKSLRYSEYYDEANIDCLDLVVKQDFAREGKYYNENKNYFQIEYDENGNRRNIAEIINAKYDQINRLNNAIKENPDDLYLIDILLNNKTEELFNEMGYISIYEDPNFMNYITEENKKDALNMIEYGINKTKKRLEENKKYTVDIIKKVKNYDYLNNRIKELENKKDIINNKYNENKKLYRNI